MRVAVLVVLLTVVTGISGAAISQPFTLGESVNDVAYDGQLYASLSNGTVVAFSDGIQAWKLTFEGYGAPVLLTPASPYGLLVLTDAAWLGLISREGKLLGWMKISVDPNAIVKGRGKLLYANGLALVYAGSAASAVKVPELEPLGYYNLRNLFLGGSVSPRGDSVMLYGFDTFCLFCIQNEEKLVHVIKPETGEQVYRGVVNNLRDAAVLWHRSWLVLAKWDAMYVYDLEGGGLEKPVKVYEYTHPMDRWLSWGFSPGGNLFHYVVVEGDSLNVVVIDVESGSIASKSLPLAPGRRVLSLVDDSYRLGVISYNTLVEATYVLFGDLAGRVLIETVKDLGTPKAIKVAGDRAIALFSGGFLVVPPLLTSVGQREEQPLAHLTVEVVDEEGRPYQGALVCANASCAATSSLGTVTLVLEGGTYILTVKHPSARAFQATIRIQGNVTKLITIERLYTLNVNVSSNGNAPKVCSIRVYDARGSKLGEASNCTTVFTLTRGVYTVEAETEQQKITQVAVVRSDTLLHFLIAIEKTAIDVSVFDENGTFLSDATIRVLDSRNVTVTSAQGRLSSQLTPGRYTVQVLRPGYLNWSSTLDLSGSLSVEVRLTRVPQIKVIEKGSDAAQVITASVAAAMVTAAGIVAAYRFNIFGRICRRAPRVSFKLRRGKR